MKTSYVSNFLKDEKGAAAIIAAFTIPVIIGLSAISLEVGRVNYIESKLAYAADAAAIAAARYDINDFQANGEKVFYANFPNGTLGVTATPTITYDDNTKRVMVTVSTTMPTKVGKYLGVTSLRVNAQSTVAREFGGLELSMVLDVTGSMAGSNKIEGLRNAAKTLVDEIYEGQNTRDNTSIALVPYVATVNIGANNTDWLTPLSSTTLTLFPSIVPWEGCIMANGYGEFDDEEIDTAPPAQRWPIYFAESTIPLTGWDRTSRDNDWEIRTRRGTESLRIRTSIGSINIGPNRSCAQPMLPLTNNAALVKSTIDQFRATSGGGTMGSLGIIWGARMLSENWNGLWSVQQSNGTIITGEPIKAYAEPTNTKAMIVMTDGGDNWYDQSGYAPSNGDPTSYGAGVLDRFIPGKLGASTRGAFDDKISEKFVRICEDAKRKGIEVYTITFRVSSSSVRNRYRNCATTPEHYSPAESNEELDEVFEKIAKQLKRIRITR